MGVANLVPLILLISEVFGGSTMITMSDVDADGSGLRSGKFDTQKNDVLINMLEAKLKEAVKNSKKKKPIERTFGSEGGMSPLGTFAPETPSKCDALKNLEMQLKSNGISGVGEVGLVLKYGHLGKGSLNIEASGISNIGKAVVDLQALDGNMFVPGLSNLFSGKNLCDSQQSAHYNDNSNNSVATTDSATSSYTHTSQTVNAAGVPAVNQAVAGSVTSVAPGVPGVPVAPIATGLPVVPLPPAVPIGQVA